MSGSVAREHITHALIQEIRFGTGNLNLLVSKCLFPGANNLKLNTVNSCQFLIFKELKKVSQLLALVGSYL